LFRVEYSRQRLALEFRLLLALAIDLPVGPLTRDYLCRLMIRD